MKKRHFLWIIFLLLLFICSYSREVLFRSINALMEGQDFFYAKTTPLPFLNGWTVGQLGQLKYVLTLIYTVIFMGVTYGGLYWGIEEKWPRQIILLVYIILTLVAVILILIGYLTHHFTQFYPYIRDIIGWIHNPLPFILLSISNFALNKLKYN